MRILLRWCSLYGNFSTHIIEIEPNAQVNVLQDIIQSQFQIQIAQQIIKLKLKDGNTIFLQLESNTQLKQYNIIDGTELIVQQILTADSPKINKISINKVIQKQETQQSYSHYDKYMRQLHQEKNQQDEKPKTNLTDKLCKNENDEYFSECDTNNTSRKTSQKTSKEEKQKSTFLKNAPSRFFSEKIQFNNMGHIHEMQQVFKDILENILLLAKTGDTLEFQQLIGSLINKENTYFSKAVNLINEISTNGWNALHNAIYFGHLSFTTACIENGADINKETLDNWTPLQLSIQQNQFEIFQYLIALKELNIDLNTLQGTALHVAVKLGRIQYIKTLLRLNINTETKNHNNQTAFDLCQSEQIKNLILYQQNKVKSPVIPSRPPIVKGTIWKVGAIPINMNQRYYYLNPDKGVLIRFKNNKDYPLQPREVIPLKDMKQVKIIENVWYMKKDFYYFSYFYKTKQILGCKSLELANKWIKYIQKGSIYSNYIETQLSKSENFTQQLGLFFLKRKNCQEDLDQVHSPSVIKRNSIIQKSQEIIQLQSFRILEKLGQNTFSSVYKVIKKSNNQIYIMKSYQKNQLISADYLKNILAYLNILKLINHPFIARLDYSFQTPNYIFMILEYCSGYDLSFYLTSKITFTEIEAKFYIAELLLAIEYLHNNDIANLNIKPTHILIDKNRHLKLTELGQTDKEGKDQESLHSFSGSLPQYPNEIESYKSKQKSIDISAIGIVLYELLCGKPPYSYFDLINSNNQNKNKDLFFPQSLTSESIDLINKLLANDRKICIQQIKQHNFFIEINWQKLITKKQEPPMLLEHIQHEDDLNQQNFQNIKVILNDLDYNEENKFVNRINDLTFIRDNFEE